MGLTGEAAPGAKLAPRAQTAQLLPAGTSLLPSDTVKALFPAGMNYAIVVSPQQVGETIFRNNGEPDKLTA